MDALERYGMLAARILLAILFLVAGLGKVTNFSGTAAYMAQAGVPAISLTLPLAVVFELGGGLSILLGYRAKTGAAGLILFTILAAYYFHTDFSDMNQQVHFMKNLAIMGGLLSIAVHGAGNISMDEGIKK